MQFKYINHKRGPEIPSCSDVRWYEDCSEDFCSDGFVCVSQSLPHACFARLSLTRRSATVQFRCNLSHCTLLSAIFSFKCYVHMFSEHVQHFNNTGRLRQKSFWRVWMRKQTRFGEICINYTTEEELFLPYVAFRPDTHFTPSMQTFACIFKRFFYWLCI